MGRLKRIERENFHLSKWHVLEFTPAPVGNRFHCPHCGGEAFFIALEAEDTPSGPLDNIECIGCHQMWTVSVRRSDK